MSGITFLRVFVILASSAYLANGAIMEPVFTCSDASDATLPAGCTAGENDGFMTINVRAFQDDATAGTVTALEIFTQDDPGGISAVEGQDYIPIDAPFVVPTAVAEGFEYSIPIIIIDNDNVDGTRTFEIDARHLLAAGGAPTDCAAGCDILVTIMDDDTAPLPTVSFDCPFYEVTEEGTVDVSVLAAGGTAAVDVMLTATDVSATTGDDYSLTLTTVTGVDTATPGLTTVTAEADGTDEGGFESFTIEIVANAALYNIGSPSKATVLIKDTAAVVVTPVLPTVSLDCPVYEVTEEGTVDVGVLSADGAAPVDVMLTATDVSATTGDDYTLSLTTVTGVDTATPGMTTVTAEADGTDEGGFESFTIEIVANPALYNVGSPSKATVLIKDKAAAPDTDTDAGAVAPPTYWIEFCDYKAAENQSPFGFNIKRSTTGSVATITYSTRDVGTTVGADYQPVVGETVTFAANSDTAIGYVNIIPDISTEDPEAFEVSIASPSTGELGGVTKATVTLYDSLSSQSKFYFDRSLYCVMESSGAEIKIRRDGDVSQVGSVVLISTNIDALSSTDYVIINNRITFAPDEVQKTHRVSIERDDILEGTEQFEVSLTQPIGGVVTSPSTTTVSIKDDDYCYSLESVYYSSTESASPLRIGISKSGYLGEATSVDFDTSAGTADENEDYTGVTTTIDFPIDVACVYVPGLNLIEDGEYENQEQFTVSISASSPNRICKASTATVFIESNDGSGNPVVGCPANYCVNGGSCVTTDSSYSCQCLDGYTGIRCEGSSVARGGLSSGAITAIVIAAVTGMLIIIMIMVCICFLTQQQQRSPATPNQVPPKRQQPGQSLNNAIMMDGDTITYGYQPELGVF